MLPEIYDPDSLDNVTVSVKNMAGILPNFITYQASTSLTIFPKLITDVKTY